MEEKINDAMAERKQFTKQQAVDNWWMCFYGARVNKRGRSKCNTRHGNRHENHRATWNTRKTQSTWRKPLSGITSKTNRKGRWENQKRKKVSPYSVSLCSTIRNKSTNSRTKGGNKKTSKTIEGLNSIIEFRRPGRKLRRRHWWISSSPRHL